MKDFIYALKNLDDKLNALSELNLLSEEQISILSSSIDQLHDDSQAIQRGLK